MSYFHFAEEAPCQLQFDEFDDEVMMG